MGNNCGEVKSGPAAGWDVTNECRMNYSSKLQREISHGEDGHSQLLSDADLNNVYSKQCFKDISCGEDCNFEYQHGAVHDYVGGHMSNIICSPNDPIFFLHHCFIDYIWEEFRRHHQKTDREREYPSFFRHCDKIIDRTHKPALNRSDFEWNRPMKPFQPLIHADGLSNTYTNFYYHYQARPRYCHSDCDCDSDILWCNKKAYQGFCHAKVREGGNCTGLPNNACQFCSHPKKPYCNALINKCECISTGDKQGL